jgi:hypothetical protein
LQDVEIYNYVNCNKVWRLTWGSLTLSVENAVKDLPFLNAVWSTQLSTVTSSSYYKAQQALTQILPTFALDFYNWFFKKPVPK